MNDAAKIKSGPRWMLWTVIACLALFLSVGLMMDLNGNVVFAAKGPFPDLLDPAPAVIMLVALGVGAIVAATHAVRYESRRHLWLGISLIFVILLVATILPVL